MPRVKTQKPLKVPVYLGNQARADRMDRLREQRGLASGSELVRRLVDEAPLRGEARGLFDHMRLPPGGIALAEYVAALERRMIELALKRTGDNVSAAARVLGITRDRLRWVLSTQKIGIGTRR